MVLLFLLAGSSLLAVLPTASAQTPAFLCLDRDPRFAGACVVSRPPAYQQGDDIGIAIESAITTPTWISVKCMAGCPASDMSATRTYWAMFRGPQLVFPRDFVDAGPQNDGGNAVLDRAPRFNSTWQVTAHSATPIQRTFRVWLYDAFTDVNDTLRPGGSYYLRATGFDPGAEVSLRWERKDPITGRYELYASTRGRAASGGAHPGWFEHYFDIPRTEARNILTCGGERFDCYRVTVDGPGKPRETVSVQMFVADVARSVDTTPRQPANQQFDMQRTQNASFEIDLYYPGGRLRNGPKMLPADIPDSVSFGGKALRVAVEKTFSVNGSVHLVEEVPLRYDEAAFFWRATWTIPKDVPDLDNAAYRLRLLEQRDAYGNRIVSDILANFTIREAEIRPTVATSFTELRRTEQGILHLAVLYHNGTPVTRDDMRNESPFSGCFVRLPDRPPEPSPPQPEVNSCVGADDLVWGRYDAENGTWNFPVKYPRDYEDLTRHRFILRNESGNSGQRVTDRFGNEFTHIVGGDYLVTRAQPDVVFSTVMRGRESDVLERGNRVFLSATITYHDGSPYNNLVRVDPNSANATILRGTLLRRGPATPGEPYGPIASEEPIELHQTDANAGRWTGFLQLTDDDTFTPVGNWTFRFDILDNTTVPNRNLTVFDREVVSTLIRLCPTFQPSDRAATGTTVKFRFRLAYSECDSGREVPVEAIEARLQAKVYRYSPSNNSAQGPPLSNPIVPRYDPEAREWGLEYVVPNELFAGTYLFVFTGADSFGNRLVVNSFSRTFTTFTDVVERAVITQPLEEVRRGDSATVVFDAREGDVGLDPTRGVRIQLERFDTSATACATSALERGCWVRERFDVRLGDPTLEDHVGVFPVGVDTPVGLYRFTLHGRDSLYRILTATSENFTVNPTEVTRAMLVPPPERTLKGEGVYFRLDSLPGDKINERVVFYNGRPIFVPAPTLTFESGTINVTWGIPFDAPVGNYTLRFVGRDVNGNVINIITPPIEALAASLEGRLLGQPARVIERGEPARVLFGVAYPDGGFYAASDTPRVYVQNAAGLVVDQATVRREGLTFAATWIPTSETPLGEYTLEVSPQATGGTGNLFPPLKTTTFRIVPGSVTRNPVDDMPSDVTRTNDVAFTVPFASDDKFAGFELLYYGPRTTVVIDTTAPMTELTRTPLPHTLDAAASKYVARLDTDQQTTIGTYRIVMTGEDGDGNAVQAFSRYFVIRPISILVTPLSVPDKEEFGEGKLITFAFTLTYGTAGNALDDTMVRPAAVMLYSNQPISQRPEIEYVAGRWIATWQAPDTLPPGDYTFTMGGSDLVGNPITTYRSSSYTIEEGSLLRSAKEVPGPSPALLLLALAAIAGAVARLRSRRA